MFTKLTIKAPERRQWRRSGAFIVKFEHISHLDLVFLLLTLSRLMLAGRKAPVIAVFTNGFQKKQFQKLLLINFASMYSTLPKHFIFAYSLLIEYYAQAAV